MDLILASGNPHKAEELNELFKDSKLNIQASTEKLEVIEDGISFQENAFKKAKAYFDRFKKPTLADDSGLVIPARADILGVQSARYAPELATYTEKNQALLKDLDGLKERKAYFVCYFCFYLNPEEVFFFEGRVHGEIGLKAQGADGFGYDPIFFPDGKEGQSLAELPHWKMEHSHRAKAVKEALKFFQNF